MTDHNNYSLRKCLQMATCENIFHKILNDLELNPLFSEIKTCISNYINFPEKPLQQKDSEAESWLKWARNRQHLKIISAEIPEGILPDNSPGHLLDVRVFTHRGPDDDIYDNNKDIRDKVARGNCFLSIHSGENRRTRCVIYALKKFTGGLGDDDDRTSGDDFTWKKYFNKPLDAASSIVATRKANGEAAHLSCLKIDDQYIICAGSKNVHLLFKNKEDVTKYVEPRYKIAREVSETVWEALEDMGEEKKNRLLEFLCVTDYTAIFEILHPDHQHVEEFTHLKKPLLQFITWCSNDLVPTESSSLCSMPPHISIEIARYLGLSTVQYDIIGVSDVDPRMSQIRQGYGYEGEVLYFLDSENNVIGLLKKKTIW
ncbi:unnamed protein product [Owenia fusiformis]|uniref:DUF7920 domain-containing protein n=1 Tax=Owenia fusiformis TaxID=6347 RepID=A0A8S4NFP7_OWEFU|nr:unnamed protein product [Owenia fusiformis]